MTRSAIYDDLFSKKLLLVTGKGGVGKSTLVYHLAKQAAFTYEKEVTIYSVGQSGFFEDRLKSDQDRKKLQDGQEVKLFPGASIQVLQTYQTFLEFIHLRMKVPKTLLGILNKPWLQNIFMALPGFTPTILMGKMCYEAKKRSEENPKSLVLIEAPPIGQVEMYLKISGQVKKLFRLGPLHKDAIRVERALQDKAFSELILVTLLDDLPIEESIEYLQEHHDPSVCLRYIICNRVLFQEQLAGKRASPQLLNHALGKSLLERERAEFKKLKDINLKTVAFGDQMDFAEGNLVLLNG